MTREPGVPTPLFQTASHAESDLLLYAGRLLETPAGVAHAVVEYAQAIAGRRISESVTIPILHEGRCREVRLLVGGSVPVAAVYSSGAESTAETVIHELQARTASRRMHVEHEGNDASRSDSDGWLSAAYSDW